MVQLVNHLIHCLILSVNCGVGTYYNTDSQSCLKCKPGTYQDEEAQTSCKTCPPGTSTVGSHSYNYTECRGIVESLFICFPITVNRSFIRWTNKDYHWYSIAIQYI